MNHVYEVPEGSSYTYAELEAFSPEERVQRGIHLLGFVGCPVGDDTRKQLMDAIKDYDRRTTN